MKNRGKSLDFLFVIYPQRLQIAFYLAVGGAVVLMRAARKGGLGAVRLIKGRKMIVFIKAAIILIVKIGDIIRLSSLKH